MKSLIQIHRTVGILGFFVGTTFLLNGCALRNLLPLISGSMLEKTVQQKLSSGSSSNNASTSGGTSNTGGGGSTATVQPGAVFGIGAISQVTMKLGTTQMFQFSVTGAPSFSGNVNLSIERDELDLADPAKYVTISLSPSSVFLSGGNTVQVQATVKVDTLAPDFNDHFHIVGTQTAVANAGVTPPAVVPFRIMPIYEMAVLGGPVPEAWGGPSPVGFRSNSAGVTIQFVNYDSALAHTIHSGGAIPHQNTGTPLVRAVNGVPQAGGTYSVLVPKSNVATQANYYCHLHEGGAQARVMNFNVGAASATFSAGVRPILNAKCVSCHQNAATGAAGVSFASYTDTLSVVVAGNAANSLLHQQTAKGLMPPIGQAALTANEKLIIMDWINAGALNN